MKYTLEQKFSTLCQITRAAHFEWRQAFVEAYPDVDPQGIVLKYWEIVGKDTAKAYLKRIDKSKNIVEQLVDAMVDSSLAMGENARKIKNEQGQFCLEHIGCPWPKWHDKYDAIDEDRPGCDKWIETIIDEFNRELNTNIKFKTQNTIPDGHLSCLRVFFEETE